MTDVGSMAAIESRSSYVNAFTFNPAEDEKLIVEFVRHESLDAQATKEADRPVYTDADFIRIRKPGERDEIFRPAHDGDRRRFPKLWAAYAAGETVKPTGTPLIHLFPRNPGVIKNLEHDGITTVEILAGLNDTQIGNIGLGGRQFVDRAKAFLESQASEQVKSAHERIAELEAKLAKMEMKR